ncbi:MAG: glycosyltransferase family 39 protein, partial [Patescibacteria group bacterium]
MNDATDARLVLLSIVLFIHLFIFLIARKFFGSERKALLANLVYLIWQPFFEGWVLWIDSFLPLFLLPAFYFLFRGIKKESNEDLALAGLFLGISLVFKQIILPLIGLTSLFLLVKTKSFRKLFWFILGVLPVPLLMLVYFWSKGILGDFWYWTVTYNLTTFAKYGRKAAFFSGIVRVAAVFGFALFGAFSKKLKEIYSWLLVFIIGS